MRLKHVLIIAAGLVLLLFLWLTREPSANGESLSTWLRQGAGPYGDPDSETAIQMIGPRAIPHLLERIRAKPPAWKVTTSKWLSKLRGRQGYSPLSYSVENEHSEAVYGFSVLSTQAVSAIPLLTKLMGDTNECRDVALCLAAIGDPAFPIIRNALTNLAEPMRDRAFYACWFNSKMNRAALPELRLILSDSDPGRVRVASELLVRAAPTNEAVRLIKTALRDHRDTQIRWALRHLERKMVLANVFVPEMTNLLNHPRGDLRDSATNILRASDPGTAQSFGIDTNKNVGDVRPTRRRPVHHSAR